MQHDMDPQVMTHDRNQSNPCVAAIRQTPMQYVSLVACWTVNQYSGMLWLVASEWTSGIPLVCATTGLTCSRDAVQDEAGCLLAATQLCKVHAGQLTTL